MYRSAVLDVYACSRRPGRCRSCRALIHWGLTTANRWHAFEPDVVPMSEAVDAENGLRIDRLPRAALHGAACRRRTATGQPLAAVLG